MEELFSLGILILFLIVNAISAIAKSKKQEDAEAQRKAVAAARIKAAQQKMATEARHQAAAIPAEPSPAASEPMQVIQPTVHAHVKPDCAEHDAPTTGSLDYISTEGKDPCHEDELTLERQPAEATVSAAPELTFDWSGENLVKAFVMQEVLQRPSARNRR